MTPEERRERIAELEAERAELIEKRAAAVAAEAAQQLRRHGFDEAAWLDGAGIAQDGAS